MSYGRNGMDVVDLCLDSDDSCPLNEAPVCLKDEFCSAESATDEGIELNLREDPPVVPVSRSRSSGIFSQESLPSKKGSKNAFRSTKENTINKASEKAQKRAAKLNTKNLKPGECLKFVTAEIGKDIFNKPYFAKITESFRSSDIKFTVDAPLGAADNCIGWVRKITEYSVDNQGQLSTKQDLKREPFLLVILDMEQMETLLVDKTLNCQMNFFKEATSSQVTLVLYESENYYKSKKRKTDGQSSSNSRKVTENDLDYYLTKLLFEESVSCIKAENPDELARCVLQYTKAIAEIPFKQNQSEVDQKANFYMRGDNKGCIQVDKNGNGLLQLWCKSLTKFPLASLETAIAICEKYQSPSSLMEFFKRMSKDDAINIIADINVRRSGGPLASCRRVGPQLASKMYTFFTSMNGGELL